MKNFIIKVEFKYFSIIVTLFLLALFTLYFLYEKYAVFTLNNFIDSCQKIIDSFSATGIHFIGFFVVAFTLFTATLFGLKSLFSFLKTQKKLNGFLKLSSDKFPYKLEKILTNHNIKKDEVIVLNNKSDYAITLGVLSPKILISTGLLGKLTGKELESVMLHEVYHKNERHGLILLASEVISSTAFFLPVISQILKKMRVEFERQADMFSIQTQATDKNIKLAISKVSASKDISLFPGFSERIDYKINRTSIIVSMFTILMGAVLYLLPTQGFAQEGVGIAYAEKCGEYQCSTHCVSQGNSEFSQHPNMTLAFQSKLIF